MSMSNDAPLSITPLEKYHLMYYVPIIEHQSQEDDTSDVFHLDKPDKEAMLNVILNRDHPIIIFFGVVCYEEIDHFIQKVVESQSGALHSNKENKNKLAIIIDSNMPETGAVSSEQVATLKEKIQMIDWIRIWEIKQLSNVISHIPISRFLES